MKMHKKISGAAPILLFSLLVNIVPASAQEAAVMPIITWQAKTYTPSWFTGKALPTANSQITAYLELIVKNKATDLSGEKVYWYVNDEFIKGGVGIQKVTFNAPAVTGNTIDLRAEVPSRSVIKTIEIPIVNPEAVIEAPFPSRMFSSFSINLNGWPFFFNTQKSSNLNFLWSVNGVTAENSENPEVLDLDLNQNAAQNSNINIGLTIRVPGSLSAIATKQVNLTFIK